MSISRCKLLAFAQNEEYDDTEGNLRRINLIDWFTNLPVYVQAFFATVFTYAMTALGAAFVFLSKGFNKKILNILQGFAAGIMISASFFSLLLPAEENLQIQYTGALPAVFLAAGFLLGGIFIIFSNLILKKKHIFSDAEKRSGAMMFFAMTLHNIPEGFAIGVAFGSLSQSQTLISAVMLAIGIGIQNFPEGMCVSVPLHKQGLSMRRAFFFGQFSGLVEIIAGVLGAVAVGFISVLLPWALAFSAGAMIAVSCSELIPSAINENKLSAVGGITVGFALMMLLDVLL